MQSRQVSQILTAPDVYTDRRAAIADQYKNNRKEFDKAAKDWVKRYAK